MIVLAAAAAAVLVGAAIALVLDHLEHDGRRGRIDAAQEAVRIVERVALDELTARRIAEASRAGDHEAAERAAIDGVRLALMQRVREARQ